MVVKCKNRKPIIKKNNDKRNVVFIVLTGSNVKRESELAGIAMA